MSYLVIRGQVGGPGPDGGDSPGSDDEFANGGVSFSLASIWSCPRMVLVSERLFEFYLTKF